MPAASRSVNPYRPLLVAGSVVLVIAALYWAQSVLIPVAVAILLTFILTPAVAALQRRGLRRLYAVLVVVLLAFTAVGTLGWVVVNQFQDLARELPAHRDEILAKIEGLQGSEGVLGNLTDLLQAVGQTIQKSGLPKGEPEREPVPVRVVESGSGLEWLPKVVFPLLEPLAAAALVVVLVIFMLIHREDLRNRLIRLIGSGRLTLTTRAMDEAGQRLSRYLLMLLVVNGSFGLTLGLCLYAGNYFFSPPLQYVFLWGFLAGVLRFIPYLGSWVAISLPVALSVAIYPGWGQPVYILAVFFGLELIINNAVEPLVYGRNVGISEVALLVAAAFWAWLWGPIGLIMSTPLTACLIVLGKYVPQLNFISVLLSDQPVLPTHARYYQRLLARDQDEAADLIEEYLESHPVDTIYDDVLIPALVLAKGDTEHGEDAREVRQFVVETTREIVVDVLAPQQHLSAIARDGPPSEEKEDVPKVLVLGCPARDEEDELALHMLRQMLEPTRCELEVISVEALTSEVLARVKEQAPALVVVASLPPGGLAHTRYLCKRLRSHFPESKIVVGRWGQKENIDKTQGRLCAVGASHVAMTMTETYNQVLPLVQVAGAAGLVKETEAQTAATCG